MHWFFNCLFILSHEFWISTFDYQSMNEFHTRGHRIKNRWWRVFHLFIVRITFLLCKAPSLVSIHINHARSFNESAHSNFFCKGDFRHFSFSFLNSALKRFLDGVLLINNFCSLVNGIKYRVFIVLSWNSFEFNEAPIEVNQSPHVKSVGVVCQQPFEIIG